MLLLFLESSPAEPCDFHPDELKLTSGLMIGCEDGFQSSPAPACVFVSPLQPHLPFCFAHRNDPLGAVTLWGGVLRAEPSHSRPMAPRAATSAHDTHGAAANEVGPRPCLAESDVPLS